MLRVDKRSLLCASGQVEYAVIPEMGVVFTGLAKPTLTTSTANEAGDIILRISQAEGLPLNRTRFFQLSTHLDCPHLEPGRFEFQRVMVEVEIRKRRKRRRRGGEEIVGKVEIVDKTWRTVKCPPEILELFKENIWGSGPATAEAGPVQINPEKQEVLGGNHWREWRINFQ